MKVFHQHSFAIVQSFVLFFLLVSFVTARPTTPQLLVSRPLPTPASIKNDTQTLKKSQTFTMSEEHLTERIVLSKTCFFTFTSSSSSTPTPVSVLPTKSSSMVNTPIISRTAASTVSILPSTFATNAVLMSLTIMSTNTTTSSHPIATDVISQAAGTPTVPVNDIGISIGPSKSTFLPLSPSTSSTDPFTSSAQSHLSTLPIFLGAFGGIAGVALLVVGIKVYRPSLKEMRLHPRAAVRRLKGTFPARWGPKKWGYTGEHSSEKLTERTSQETYLWDAQTDEPPNRQIS